MAAPLLDIRDLRVRFQTDTGSVYAVNGLSLHIERGETLGIVGESGSGKSVTSLAIMGLLPKPAAHITAQTLRFDGQDLLTLPAKALRRLRGDRLAMIFQDPMSALNPFLRISRQLTEVLQIHRGRSAKAALRDAIAMLERVGIPDPSKRVHSYPHELSGGMRQRVMIAMNLLCQPQLLIADEPTTALDVTIQAQILDLIADLQQERDMAVILVTHDLGVVAGIADRVTVLYGGQVMESAPTQALFDHASHPYTRGLLRAVPRLLGAHRDRLYTIPGIPPILTAPEAGCPFAPRCDRVQPVCQTAPSAHPHVDAAGHLVFCHHPEPAGV